MLKQRNYLIFVAIFFTLFVMLMQNFLFGMLTGVVVAVSLWPYILLIQKKSKFIKTDPGEHALLISLLFCIIFLFPLIFAAFEFYDIYLISSKYIAGQGNNIQPPPILNTLPFSEYLIKFWQTYITSNFNYVDILKQITNEKIISFSSYILNSLFSKLVTFFTILITFYFSLKYGNLVKQNYDNFFSNVFGEKSVKHIQHGITSLRGTINGVLLIGILEGILLSIPLILGDIPSGFSIGIIAGVLGVIPLLMPILILPCLIYLHAEGQTIIALIGLIDLFIVWTLFENIIKPKLISKSSQTNPFLILASMIGGIQAFGILGLFVGPAIASMSFGILKEFLISIKNKD